ncbi:hypothetical protein FHT87_004585 [Rhizobium sp. BK316]|nr:hypothetical protein [Rhizobium sp. BK316]
MDLTSNITRRNTLKGAATISAAAAIPTAVGASERSGFELVAFHLEELRKALEVACGGTWSAAATGSERTILLMRD